jgi:hypothetical protein
MTCLAVNGNSPCDSLHRYCRRWRNIAAFGTKGSQGHSESALRVRKATGAGAEHREAEDAIAARVDERLHETARLADGSGTKDRVHGQACHSDRNSAALGVRLPKPHPAQLGIDEHAVGHQAIAGRPRTSRQIVAHHPEVVVCDVRELRAAGALAHRPKPQAEASVGRADIAIWSCSLMTAIAGKTPQERKNRTESNQHLSGVFSHH